MAIIPAGSNLRDVASGDRLALTYGRHDTPAHCVVAVTSAMQAYVIDETGRRWARSDGAQLPRDKHGSSRLRAVVCTAAKLDEIEREACVSRVFTFWEKARKATRNGAPPEITLSALRAVSAAIASTEGKDHGKAGQETPESG